jgi:hypothetical protein
MFDKLLRIANKLDEHGYYKESNDVARLIVSMMADDDVTEDEADDDSTPEEDDVTSKDVDDKKYAESEKNKGKKLNKPFRTPGGPKKFSVYVKNEKGNVVKVNFGDPNMRIKDNIPGRRKNFRARHNCDNPGSKTKARYWSCRQWSDSKSDI